MWPQIFGEDLQQKKSFYFILSEAEHEMFNLHLFIYLFWLCWAFVAIQAFL